MLYGFRVTGPAEPTESDRFNPSAVLLDPYAHGVVSRPVFAEPGLGGDCWPQMLATLPDAGAPLFDWQGTTSPNRPLEDLVIYECHVRGFTRSPSSGAAQTCIMQSACELPLTLCVPSLPHGRRVCCARNIRCDD